MDGLEHFPAIINAAAKSPLGIIALAMLIIGVAGVIMFKNLDDPRYRLSAFGILVVAVLLGAGVVLTTTPGRCDPDKLTPEEYDACIAKQS